MQQDVRLDRVESAGAKPSPLESRGPLHHRTAAFRARAAGSDAFLHTRERLAVLGADLADLRAKGAGLAVELTLMRHQISGQLADRDAIHHQAEMLRSHMIAAHFEAFGHRRGEANRMAAQALFDAMTGFMGELIHRANPRVSGGVAGTRGRRFPFR